MNPRPGPAPRDTRLDVLPEGKPGAHALDAGQLRARRRRHILPVLAIPVLAASLWTGQALFVLCALLLVSVDLIPELWFRYGLSGVSAQRSVAQRTSQFGGLVDVELLVENRKPLPLPWMEVNDEFPQGVVVIGRPLAPSPRIGRATLRQTLALAAYQRVRRRYRLLAAERGVFHFGPTLMRTSDPFAMLTAEVERDAAATLITYPLTPSVERLGLAPLTPFGSSRARLRLLEDPLRVSGVREYAPGDEPRRIHWKATARMGTLQSKIYESSTRLTITIFLDLRAWPGASAATDEALSELAIATVAGITDWALSQGCAVGLCANCALDLSGSAEGDSITLQRAGERLLRVAPSASPRQLVAILDALARLQTLQPAPMDALLDRERARLATGSTVIYVGARTALDEETLAALRRTQARGHPLTLLLTEGGAADNAPDARALAGLDWRAIGGRALWRDLQREALGAEVAERLEYGVTPAFIALHAAQAEKLL